MPSASGSTPPASWNATDLFIIDVDGALVMQANDAFLAAVQWTQSALPRPLTTLGAVERGERPDAFTLTCHVPGVPRSLTFTRQPGMIRASDRAPWVADPNANAERLAPPLTDLPAVSPDAIFVLDAYGRFTFVNDAAVRLLRRTRDELLGTHVWQAFPQGLGSVIHERYDRTRAEGGPNHYRVHFAPLERWFEVSSQRVRDSVAVHFRDVTADVTARERAECLAAFATTLAGAQTLEDVGRAFNAYAARIFGVERASLVTYEPDTHEFRTIGVVGLDETTVMRAWGRFPAGLHTPFRDAFEQRDVVVRPLASDVSRQYEALRNAAATLAPGAVVAVPLMWTNDVVGIIGLNYARSVDFDEAARVFLRTVAAMCGQAVARIRLFGRLQRSERQFRALSESAGIGVLHASGDGRVRWVNARLLDLLDRPEADVTAFAWKDLMHPDGLEPFVRRMSAARQGETVRGEHRFRAGSQRWKWLRVTLAPLRLDEDAGDDVELVGTVEDVTTQHDIQERLLSELNPDPLTALPSRTYLHARATPRLEAGAPAAVLFIDLDRFQVINNSLGHAVGDAVLRAIALRLTKALPSDAVVTRHGGDEFIAFVEGADTAEARRIAESIVRTVEAPFVIEPHTVYTSCRVGISVAPHHGVTLDTLTRKADAAMRVSKRSPHARTVVYDERVPTTSVDALDLEADLRRALRDGEFVLHYQPQVNLRSGRVVAFEALVRWQHPTRGLLAPGLFLPLAVETGLIVPLGEWVLRRAYAQVAAWIDAGWRRARVAVNVDAMQFAGGALERLLQTLWDERALPPDALDLEITEQTLLGDERDAAGCLAWLQAHGQCVSIDDFGQAYSNLRQLQRLHVDRLKIDRAYVHGVATDAKSRAVTQAMIGIGRALGLRVLAEGVETKQDAEMLRALGCDEGQGYYWGRPSAAVTPPTDDVT